MSACFTCFIGSAAAVSAAHMESRDAAAMGLSQALCSRVGRYTGTMGVCLFVLSCVCVCVCVCVVCVCVRDLWALYYYAVCHKNRSVTDVWVRGKLSSTFTVSAGPGAEEGSRRRGVCF